MVTHGRKASTSVSKDQDPHRALHSPAGALRGEHPVALATRS